MGKIRSKLKQFLWFPMCLILLLTIGCGPKQSNSNFVSEQPTQQKAVLENQEINKLTGPEPEDIQLMEQIRIAINNYGMTTGFFPASLDDLVPQYLSSSPRTSNGELFIYNNQNGNITHPRVAVGESSSTVINVPTQQRSAQETNVTVYITDTGKMYHLGNCRHVSKSKKPIPLSQAKRSYQPCSQCKPPR